MTDHLLPNNATPIEVSIAEVDALRYPALDVDVIRRVHRPDEAPASFLPILAWEYSVDEWEPGWTDAQKRQAIKVSVDIHRHKGTAWAVEQAVAVADARALVEEWFEYGGTPYYFRLTIELEPEEPWAASTANTLIRAALRSKNVRSYLEAVHLIRTRTHINPYIGAFLQMDHIATLAPTVVELMTARPYLYVGVSVEAELAATIE